MTVAIGIAAVAMASFLYRWLVIHRLEQTSALFIGIPAFLAIVVVFAAETKSATGLICKVTAVALLASGIFLGEGFICILMASPLFFLVAVIVGRIIDWSRSRKSPSQTTMTCLLLLAFLPMSMEGTSPKLSFDREELVQRELVVDASEADIANRLGRTPVFDQSLPAFLKLGFPRPTEASGAGLTIGSKRVIHFAGGEGKPGDLILEVTSSGDQFVEFRALSDSSHVAHWMTWQTTRFEWSGVGAGKARVRCVVRYRRMLDPTWYFKPWERYAVAQATDYLMASLVESAPR
jgi:hypothetical protein